MSPPFRKKRWNSGNGLNCLWSTKLVEIWEMTLQEVPEVFETCNPNDYRVCDKDQKNIRLPYKPYLALLIQEVKE